MAKEKKGKAPTEERIKTAACLIGGALSFAVFVVILASSIIEGWIPSGPLIERFLAVVCLGCLLGLSAISFIEGIIIEGIIRRKNGL